MDNSTPRTVPSLWFSTETLAPEDRFDVWRSHTAALAESAPIDGTDRAAFSVESTAWNLGEAIITHGRYSGHERDRNPAVVRRSGMDGYRLTHLITGGPIGLETGDERRLFQPGELFVTEFGRPDRQVTPGPCGATGIFLPREAVDALLPRPARLHGLMIRGPLAVLLRDHTRALARTLAEGVPVEAAPALALATLQLFAAAVSGVAPVDDEVRRSVGTALRRRIVAYIDAHLLDPDLNQETLCRAFHMSRASLYRLFRPLGGVAAHVQERRLACIHAELRDPTRHHHLGRLAETYGFSSQTQMGRAYKVRYGTSPSEAVGMAVQAPEPGQEYDRWLRALGG